MLLRNRLFVGAELAPPLARPAASVERAGRASSAPTVVLLIVLTVPLGAQAPASSSWAQFRGTARLSGVATTAPPATLAVKWTYEAGESVESSAAIADGAVYVGSTKGELLALDLDTVKLHCKSST